MWQKLQTVQTYYSTELQTSYKYLILIRHWHYITVYLTIMLYKNIQTLEG